ncbi:MAG: hypothetical protein HY978_03290 [Candidatus Liptonbacteria bacterium]|nr:hypothetical protein [Candidatus Liptonbacteria bacterium]
MDFLYDKVDKFFRKADVFEFIGYPALQVVRLDISTASVRIGTMVVGQFFGEVPFGRKPPPVVSTEYEPAQ